MFFCIVVYLKKDVFCVNEIILFLSSLNYMYNDFENYFIYKEFVDYELIKIRFVEILDINIYFYFI